EGHLSYRIALRTFSPAESRAVIGTSDAYNLPRMPGSGYFKVGTNVYTRFRAALVSQPYRPAAPSVALQQPRPFTVAHAAGPAPVAPAPPTGEDAGGASVLETVVNRVRDAAPRVHQVWLPPLEPAVSLAQLLGSLVSLTDRGLVAAGWPGTGSLTVPLAMLD